MIKIRISYTDNEDFNRIISELKSFKIVRMRKEQHKGVFKNRWVELQRIG